jgi:hypothetical protein
MSSASFTFWVMNHVMIVSLNVYIYDEPKYKQETW